MCTLTWSTVREGGYDLLFNRDERNTRGAEQPPRLDLRGGVGFAAPRDGDRGGTWLLTNAHGVTVALLNDYAVQWRPPSDGTVSRGEVVLACAPVATAEEAAGLVGGMSLARTGPFRMVAVGADGQGRRLRWDGERLSDAIAEGLRFETSSSFATEAVCESRRRRFEALLAGRERAGRDELEAFHWAHDATNGAASVLMRRPDARTRSVIRVGVRADRVDMHYRPVGEDCRPVPGADVDINFARS